MKILAVAGFVLSANRTFFTITMLSQGTSDQFMVRSLVVSLKIFAVAGYHARSEP